MALSWLCRGLPCGNQACLVGKAFVNGGLTGKKSSTYYLFEYRFFQPFRIFPSFPRKSPPQSFPPRKSQKISENPSKVTNLEPRGVKVQALWPSLPRHVLPQHLTLPLEFHKFLLGISLKKQEICPHETAIHKTIWFFFPRSRKVQVRAVFKIREKGLVNYLFVGLMSLSHGHLSSDDIQSWNVCTTGQWFQPPKHQRKQKNSSLSISKNTPENMQSVRYAMVLLVPMVTLAMDSSEGSSGDFKGSNQSTYDDFFGAESGWAKSWEVAGSNV